MRGIHDASVVGEDARRGERAEAAALEARGWSLVHTAPHDALPLLEEAALRARALRDDQLLSTALRHVGYAHYNLGDFEAALVTAREAVEIARRLDDPFLVAAAVNVQGIAHRYRGEPDLALEAQLEHLRLARELRHELMCAHALNNIGSVHLDLGEYDLAREYHAAAAELATELGEDGTRLKARNNLAADLYQLGRRDEAAAVYAETLALARRLGYIAEEALALNGLARDALVREAPEEARTFAELARVVAGRAWDRGMAAEARLHEGRAHAALGAVGPALDALREAERGAEAGRFHGVRVEALRALTDLHEACADSAAALETLRRAHALELAVHAETTARRTRALAALVEAERFRREAEQERERSTELLAANVALREARARQDELTARLAHQASHDALTGLPNRVLLQDRLGQALASAAVTSGALGVLFIDLDDFKFVNDTLGHAAGDALLRDVARRLQGVIFGRDTVARLGGDEFVVIAPHLASRDDAAKVARKLLSVFHTPFVVDDHELRVGVSIGVSVFPLDGDDAATLMRHADMAMYQAKRSGKNDVRFFAPAMDIEAQARLELEGHLRGALERGEFALHYQPQFRGAALAGFEALLRWTSPALGAVSPGRFIPIAEDTGAIVEIGAWALHEACRQSAEWERARGAPVPIAVNVSPVQFAREDFVETVEGALARHGLAGASLELEVTERLVLRDLDLAARTFARLRTLGVRLALDDFGTGQSALSALLYLPLDTLKIDRSFVMALGGRPEAERVVGAVVALADALGLDVVAEGVETGPQRDIVRRLGCERLQGFLLGRPAAAATAAEFLR